MNLSGKILILAFLIVRLPLFSASNHNGFKRCLIIFKEGEVIGTVREELRYNKKNLSFEKHLQYTLGDTVQIRFEILNDFSYFKGYLIKKRGKKVVFSSEDDCFERGKVLPSSIIHLYIHKLIKEGRAIPGKVRIFYEPKGEILNVKVESKKRQNFFVLNYFFEGIRLNILEIFYPENNMFYQKAGNTYLIDRRMEKEMLSEIKNSLTVSENRVDVPEDFKNDFTDFFKECPIVYEIMSPYKFFVEEDNRQEIISRAKKDGENAILLKVLTRDAISDNSAFPYEEYIQSLDKSYKIDSISSYITQSGNSREEKIKKIIDWLSKNIVSKDNASVNPTAVLENKEGECQGISNLFLLMCSSLDIPARAAVGLVILKHDNGYFCHFHQWAEVYEKGHWKSCDPAFGTCKIKPNYIKLFTIKRNVDILKVLNAMDLKVKIVKEEGEIEKKSFIDYFHSIINYFSSIL